MNNGKKENRWVKFGKWVRRERLSIISPTTGRPITQGEAGRRARAISRVHWTRIEAGDTGVKETTIPLIARGLGRTTEDQIKEVYRQAGFAVETESFELPPSMRHFIELPAELQQAISRQVDAMYTELKKAKNQSKK
jgi:hypothetical protein